MGARPAGASVVLERRVEWVDTDASGHHHHALILRLAEAAEHLLHRRLGLGEAVTARMPRAQVTVAFRRPLRFGDRLATEVVVRRVGRTSITYGIEVRTGDGEVAADGEVVAVLLTQPAGEPCPWPADWREMLERGGPQHAERLVDDAG